MYASLQMLCSLPETAVFTSTAVHTHTHTHLGPIIYVLLYVDSMESHIGRLILPAPTLLSVYLLDHQASHSLQREKLCSIDRFSPSSWLG